MSPVEARRLEYESLRRRPDGERSVKTVKIPTTRYDLLKLLLPSPIVGVEVGTDTGINARELLLSRPDLFLWTVDPYLPCPGYEYHKDPGRAIALRHYEERVGEFIKAGRTRHLKLPSVQAARHLSGGLIHEGETRCLSLDFVYLDGDHSAGAVKEDLEAWWPLLLSGGMMAGHDFEDPGVHTPVIKFARDNRLDLIVLNEHGDPDIVPQELRGPNWTKGHGLDRWGGWAHPSFILWKP